MIEASFSGHKSESGRFGEREIKEISLSRRAWFGGAFEAGGGIYFSIDKKRNAVTPRIEIADSDPAFARKLYEEFGGSFHCGSSKSFAWTISGYRACRITMSMYPFAPSRRKVIELIRSLGKCGDPKMQVTMVKKFREEKVADSNRADDYLDDYLRLLEIPEFVAGIIDARGIVYSSDSASRHSPQLRVQTTNRSLAEALKIRFGGEIRLDRPKGSIVREGNKKSVTKKDQLHWSLGMGGTARLYQFIRLHLLGNKIKGYEAPGV